MGRRFGWWAEVVRSNLSVLPGNKRVAQEEKRGAGDENYTYMYSTFIEKQKGKKRMWRRRFFDAIVRKTRYLVCGLTAYSSLPGQTGVCEASARVVVIELVIFLWYFSSSFLCWPPLGSSFFLFTIRIFNNDGLVGGFIHVYSHLAEHLT